MIWDDVRKVAPVMRHPDIQVIKVPIDLVRPQAESDEANWKSFVEMIPTAGAGVDGSWIRPPFARFVIVSQFHDDACIYVEAHTKKTHSGEWIEGDQWSFNAAFYLNVGWGLGIVGHASSFTGSDGFVRASTQNDAEMVRIQENLKLEAAARGIPTIPVKNTSLYANLTEYMSYCVIVTMALMSCKNVSRATVAPPRQQRRAAERSGLPLVSWHELSLVLPGTAGRSNGSTGGGESMALHFIRGHFKDYRETGLFGRQKGVYWWSPQLQGKADRVVLKGYSVESGDWNG